MPSTQREVVASCTNCPIVFAEMEATWYLSPFRQDLSCSVLLFNLLILVHLFSRYVYPVYTGFQADSWDYFMRYFVSCEKLPLLVQQNKARCVFSMGYERFAYIIYSSLCLMMMMMMMMTVLMIITIVHSCTNAAFFWKILLALRTRSS